MQTASMRTVDPLIASSDEPDIAFLRVAPTPEAPLASPIQLAGGERDDFVATIDSRSGSSRQTSLFRRSLATSMTEAPGAREIMEVSGDELHDHSTLAGTRARLINLKMVRRRTHSQSSSCSQLAVSAPKVRAPRPRTAGDAAAAVAKWPDQSNAAAAPASAVSGRTAQSFFQRAHRISVRIGADCAGGAFAVHQHPWTAGWDTGALTIARAALAGPVLDVALVTDSNEGIADEQVTSWNQAKKTYGELRSEATLIPAEFAALAWM
jgi:hypothetical protein